MGGAVIGVGVCPLPLSFTCPPGLADGADRLRPAGGLPGPMDEEIMLAKGGLLLAALMMPALALAGPRVASMNLCADELVLRLADREQIASVSFLALEARISTVADLAATVPINHGQAEDVVVQRPDLVIAGKYTTRTTVALLRRLGLPVAELDVPVTFEAVQAQIREVAAHLGQAARGEAMVDDIDRRLAAVRPAAGRIRALVLSPNGVTAGPGSLVDTLLVRAGLVNLGRDPALAGYTSLPLEMILNLKPDLLIMDMEPLPAPSLAHQVLRHPALRDLPFRMAVVGVPNRLWTCAGPAMVEAVEILADAGRQIEEEGQDAAQMATLRPE